VEEATTRAEERRIVFRESPLAHRFLDGLSGLEIGAGAHNPFGLDTKTVGLTEDLDARDFQFFKDLQVSFCGEWAQIDIAADAHAIPVADSSQDFVLHSHVWSYLANPLGALAEWTRVVRDGGVIFVIVPKRDVVPYDAARPVTPLSVHVRHYELRSTHQSRAAEEGFHGRGHYSVFSPSSLREMVDWFNRTHRRSQLREAGFQETDDKVGNGHAMVLRVRKASSPDAWRTLRTVVRRAATEARQLMSAAGRSGRDPPTWSPRVHALRGAVEITTEGGSIR
jgi:SAM-dependent methyltransferase